MGRNEDRFPSDFCFQLSDKETNDLRCQKGTTNFLSSQRRYNPYAYTEEGIITLAGVLKNDIAAKMSVEMARKFIQMRKFILENGDVLLALARLQNRQIEFENETNRKFDEILKLISKADLSRQAIFSAGQFYDAYEFISSIIRKANSSIGLIDPYCDVKAFTFLKNKNSYLHARDGLVRYFLAAIASFCPPNLRRALFFHGFFYKFLRFLGLRAALIPNEAKQVEPILKVAP